MKQIDRENKNIFAYHFHKSTDSKRKQHLSFSFSLKHWADFSVIIPQEVRSNTMFPGTYRRTDRV